MNNILKCHPGLDPGSSTLVVVVCKRHAWKIPNQVWNDTIFEPAGMTVFVITKEGESSSCIKFLTEFLPGTALAVFAFRGLRPLKQKHRCGLRISTRHKAVCVASISHYELKKHPFGCFLNSYGEGEIRTLDTVSRMQSFQDCALNRSATSPKGFVGKYIYYIKLKRI